MVGFDDITHLIQAERDAAGKVGAGRLATRSRTRLTPIQLRPSALQQKLKDNCPNGSRHSQARHGTIVSHVAALKGWSTTSDSLRACIAQNAKP